MSSSSDAPLVATRWVEIGLALFTAALGAIVMYGSQDIGIGWGDSGPEAGYFPFYIGLLLSAASLGNLLLALCRWRALDTSFVARTAFRRVLAVFLPIAAYVAAMPFAGIYLASALFIAWFMWRDRSRDKPYGVPLIVTLSCGAALASYLVFAVWFKVPLDAGILADLAAFVERQAMSEFDSLMQGMSLVLSAHHLGLMVIGVLLGILVGVLPGLGAPNGVALLLPLTFSMSPVSAIILLSCMYWGALFGGSITSILFNIPGEPSSVATTFDGYPMARNGQAGEALTAAFTSALLGALVGVLLLTFLSTHIARFALAFSSPEFFAVYLLAFCTFIGMSRNPPLKTLVAMTIGFAMAAVGMDTVSGDLRLTFDQPWLLSGLSFEVAVIGLFGIGEILCTVEEGLVFRGERARITPMVILRTWARLPRYWLTWLRSALVGCWMGVTPGGPTAASFMSYSLARRFSKNRENFGKGEVEGVIAPETADHSAGTSALLPMLTLGIPGSATAAVMLGGLMIWGLHPGPTLFVEQHDFVWGLIASMYLGNVVSLIVVLATVPLFASILRIPFAIVAPIIVMVCAIGAYSVHNAMLDVVLMLLFGALGYLFKKLGYPIAPLVLAAVLGDKAEDAFRQSMLFSDGQLSVFWSNPLVASLTGAALAMLLWPLLARCAGALFRRGRRSLRHAA